MSTEITEELQLKLLELCTELQLFQNKTESILNLSKEKFKQVDYVMKPWEISNNNASGEDKCLCTTLSTIQVSANDEESALLNNISKTLNNAEVIRKKSISGVKTNLKRSSESDVKNKTKASLSVTKSTSIPASTKSTSAHNPCCPLFKTSFDITPKYLSLSEALEFHKIPYNLQRIIKDSKHILYNKKSETKLKNNYKDMFMKNLEKQNDDFCLLCQENDSSITTFLTYLSALNSYEKKRTAVKNNYFSWMFYNNIKDLETSQILEYNIIMKESWSDILNFVKKVFIINTRIEDWNLNQKQKVYLFKILKTICNYVQLSVHTVPIFKVRASEISN